MSKLQLCGRKTAVFDGRKYTLYSIGWFGMLVHRSKWTIRWWERKGILPKPLLSLNTTTRWYLADEIAGYARIYQRAGVRSGKKIEDTSFKQEAHVYHALLEKRIHNNSKELQLKMTNDEVILKALNEKKETRFNREIEKIMDKQKGT